MKKLTFLILGIAFMSCSSVRQIQRQEYKQRIDSCGYMVLISYPIYESFNTKSYYFLEKGQLSITILTYKGWKELVINDGYTIIEK